MMETLADYGTVQYFGVATFTTGIFKTWFGLGSTIAASQLSALLLFFVLCLIVWSRARAACPAIITPAPVTTDWNRNTCTAGMVCRPWPYAHCRYCSDLPSRPASC